VPTAVFSTSTWSMNPTVRAVVDVGHLMRFRAGSIRRRGRVLVVASLFALITLGAAIVPAFTEGAGGAGRAFDLLLLLPTALAGFTALTVMSAVASGGGRELIAHEQAWPYPISPTTDHLGALLLAPLNVAFLIQAWALLGVTSYVVGPGHLVAAQIVVVLWVASSTAGAQVVAWSIEGVRRVPHGVVGVRLLTVLVLGLTLGLQMADYLTTVLDQIPTTWVVVGMVHGFSQRWLEVVALLLVLLIGAVALGAVPATIAARRVPRDQVQLESGHHEARPDPRSPFLGLLRTDRASVWRAVPMRRGLAVLAIGPGLVALIGDLPWNELTILPGLVASGGALLFGVNAWCLEGRGGLWRESLPVDPSTVFAARSWVLAEFLLVASGVTVALAAVRAGVPSASELAALVCAIVVVTVQVVGAAMRWSAQRPFAVDLRAARATPAPPVVMVGYSSRLALSTTMTGLVFSGLARAPDWRVTVLLAAPFLCWSMARLLRTRDVWIDPVQRARITTTVAV
jgi:hypothetical protein